MSIGLHCSDCVFSSFSYNRKWGKWQGACSRGYTLADPHVYSKPDMFFAERPRDLVPLTDPWGREYLRTDNICKQFLRPTDATPEKRREWEMRREREAGEKDGNADA